MKVPTIVILSFLWCVGSVDLAYSQEAEPSAVLIEAEDVALTARPVPGKLTSPFGWRDDPVKKKRRRRRKRRHRRVRKEHKGLDFAGRRGTPIHAAGPGIVSRANLSRSYGRIVIVDHGNGLETRYAHMQRFKVKRGTKVEAGSVVGTVGSSGRATGPHLHFEVRKNGKALPPSDVVKFALPECKERARDCKRPPRTKPNS